MAGSYKPVQYGSSAVAPEVRIEGLQEAIAMLDDLPEAVILAGFATAIDAANVVFWDLLGRSTWVRQDVDSKVTPGALRAALTSRVTLDTHYRGGLGEVGYGKLGYIANFLEYGHRIVGHRRGGRKEFGFVAARPRMRPAFDAGHEKAIDAFTGSIQGTVKNFQAKWGLAKAA
jgi:hypothetical protein